MTDPIRLRASGIAELFDCPARWYARNVLNIQRPKSAAAQLGTAVHKGTEVYDASRMDGQQGLSIDDAAGAMVDAIWHPEEETDWSDRSQSETEKIALPLHRMYCERLAPQQDFVAVEVTCDDLVFDDLGIKLTGTIDRCYVDEEGRLGIADIKTSGSIVSADGTVNAGRHAPQIGVYEMIAAKSLGVDITAPARIFGLQVAKTPAGRRAGIGYIHGAKDLLLGTDERPGMLEDAAFILKSGRFFGNASSNLCKEKFCPIYHTCHYRRG